MKRYDNIAAALSAALTMLLAAALPAGAKDYSAEAPCYSAETKDYSEEAQDYSVTSPDGQLVMTIHNGAELTYDLSFGGKTIVAESPMGFSFNKEEDMCGGFEVKNSPSVIYGVEKWTPAVKNRNAEPCVEYNALTLRLGEKSGARRDLGLEVRVMNGAAAFRYTLYGNMNAGMRYITKELTGFRIGAGAALYKSNYEYSDPENHPGKSSQEGEFTRTAVSALEPGSPVGLPCLIQAGPQLWMAITEACLDNFPAFHLEADDASAPAAGLEATAKAADTAACETPAAAGRAVATAGETPAAAGRAVAAAGETPAGEGWKMLRPVLTPLYTEPETELCARFDQELTSSWRVIMVADSPGRFIESDVIQSLNPPCAIDDTSWIKPGMSAWDHWWSGEVKMEMPVIKEYIDLAAEMDWPYMLVDWTWYGPYATPEAVITRPAEQLDMPEIFRYAKSRGVKIWLWLRSEDTNNNDAWREAFPLFRQWGAVGVKIDFMDREDQDMVNWYRRIIKACAENRLMVDFHGAYKPDGIERTWPNMLTREGVMGNEYNKWSDRVTPEHNINLAFTRMIAGPMDYTPGGFLNETVAGHNRTGRAGVINTRAAELGKFVVYESPLTVFCDHPSNVLGQSGSDFLKGLPTEWDETRFLGGAPDEYIAVARRNGGVWYIGVIGGSTAREMELDLSFLGEGPVAVEYWQDGRKAAKQPTDLSHGTLTLKGGAPLRIRLAPSGGYVAKVAQSYSK